MEKIALVTLNTERQEYDILSEPHVRCTLCIDIGQFSPISYI